MFSSIVDGTAKPMEALAGLLKRIAEVMMQNAIMGMAMQNGGNNIFGWIGSLLTPATIPSFATGTSNFSGGLAQVNERGGEIMRLPSGTQIYPHDVSMAMARDGGVTRIEVVPSPYFDARVDERSTARAQVVTGVGLSAQARTMRGQVMSQTERYG
jgi:hypothetical protein